MKAIDFEYYGYLDEDDGVIVPLEQECEKKCRSSGASRHDRWRLLSFLTFGKGGFLFLFLRNLFSVRTL